MGRWMKKRQRVMEIGFLAILILFPLRHAAWGLDFWDTGYNYANYTYASPQHMGTMWWFSTYLSNLIGHALTLLPFGDTLIGMNVYTGLSAGLISALGYYFCTRKLKMPAVTAFAGELLALCLCWCPTAKLYDYLTYLFFLLCVIFLYDGLTEHRKSSLILAGAFLGINVFVRFSNLPEAGLILAVWAYALLERKPKRAGAYTLWCLIGYLIPLILGFGWIALRYGIGEYVEGIRLLFAMTETATDYRASSMLYGLIWPFWEGKYWLFRILLFAVAAVIPAFAAGCAPLCFGERKKSFRALELFSGVWSFCMGVILVFWLLYRQGPSFTSFFYESYDPIYWPAVMFLVMAMGAGAADVLRKGAEPAERLLGGMVILILLLTSLGSNNGIYPSFNNLFVAAPYVLHRLALFTCWAKERAGGEPGSGGDVRLNFVPVSFLGWTFLALLLFQFAMFGMRFAFCEGTGIQERGYEVENNHVLGGVDMSYQRARWMGEISGFANENRLAGQEVILYGEIPSLSFYLQMPPAISAWCDLASYHETTMQADLERLAEEIGRGERKKPVVIAERLQCGEAETPEEAKAAGRGEGNAKWRLILQFMERYGYRKTFENGKFVIWQAEE